MYREDFLYEAFYQTQMNFVVARIIFIAVPSLRRIDNG